MCCEAVKAFDTLTEEREKSMSINTFRLVSPEKYVTYGEKKDDKIRLKEFKKSSNIKGVGYHNNKLFVLFSTGIVYSYDRVPLNVAAVFLTTEERRESAGKFFNQNIKSNKGYSFEKVGGGLVEGYRKS